jgi:hypothetical protein
MGVKCVFMGLALSPLNKYWRGGLGERVSLSPLNKYWRDGVGGKGIFKSFK